MASRVVHELDKATNEQYYTQDDQNVGHSHEIDIMSPAFLRGLGGRHSCTARSALTRYPTLSDGNCLRVINN